MVAIANLVERGLLLWQEERDEARRLEGKELKTHPFVTDAGKECERQIVFSLINEPESDPLTVDSLLNFSLGGVAEEWLSSLLVRQGIDFLREVRIEIPHNDTVISGRIDFLLLAAPHLVELKTTSSKSMSFIARRGGQDAHKKQLNLYLYASQHGYIRGRRDEQEVVVQPMSEGRLVYVVKDAAKGRQNLFEFPVEYSEAQAVADLTRLAALQAQAEQGYLPPMIAGADKNKFPCGWCSWRLRCHG